MKITENFTYIGTQQNFERDSYATLAEMKAVVDKRMPDIFTATCKETGKFYIYNKSNEVDETLGKWREISIDGNDYVTKTYVDTEIAKKADIDHTHTTVNGHTVESDVPVDAKFTDTIYDDTDIKAEIAKKADITSIPSKVSELTNDSNYQTAEQVSSTVTTEIAKVVADAPEDLNTLKEMSDWIAGHENDASAMNSAISDNKTAITALQSGKADKSEIPTTVTELTDSSSYAKKTDLHSHTNKTVLDGITSTKVSNWDSAKTHADSAHAPSTAQANVIETVKVNGTALTPSSKAVNVIVPTKVSELTDGSDYAKKTDIPTTLPANGGNADTVNNHTVESNVPADAKFTDTVYDDTEIKAEIAKKADITSIPSKVSELTNDSNYQTAEQVNDTVATEIAKVVANAPEDLNTLKEMSDWIAGHEEDASAMNSAISDNKAAITALQSGKADKSEIPTTVAELTGSADYAKKTDIPTTLPANGGNADTVNNHTVESDVPVDAVFTDTTYESVTQTEDGLMSAADKTKLDGINVSKVGSVSKGSGTKPIYLSNGVPTECSYTLGTACQKAYTDSSAASAIGTGTSLVTERDVYYGLPKFNGGHSYTSGNDYYAAESAGTEGYILKSGGAGKAPVWSNDIDIVYRRYKITSDIYNQMVNHRYLYLGTMEGDSSKVSFDLIIEGVRSNVGNRNHFDILLSTGIGYQIGSVISCSSPNILAKAIVLANDNEPMTDHSSDKVFNVYFDLKALTGNYLGVVSNIFCVGPDEFAISIANLTAESNATISLIDQITETNNKSELSYKCIITCNTDEIACGSMVINDGAILMYGFGNTVSSPSYSILIGYKCSINNNSSGVCIGERNTNTGTKATTLGELCTAAAYAQAFGYNSNASNPGMMAIGHNNASPSAGGSNTNTSGTAFAIGKGTSTSSKSNAFSVSFTGVVKSASTMTAATTADYAEYFEWQDGNPNGEDRVGKFVTIDGDKIKVATEGDYILGIVSGQPFLLGNGDCDTWNGMYLRDEFNRIKYEPAPKVEFVDIVNEDGLHDTICKEVEGEYEGTRPILNPDYDPNLKYINRADRPEWAPIGMLGVLAVYTDGTPEVNGFAKCNADGIATKCTRDTRNSYRVIKKVSDKVVEVIFR